MTRPASVARLTDPEVMDELVMAESSDKRRRTAILDDLSECYGDWSYDDPEWVEDMVEASLESDDYWRSWGGRPR